MDIKERMKNSKLYYPTDENLIKEQSKCLDKLFEFNHTRPSDKEKRQSLLKEILGSVGDDCHVEGSIYANWGINTHFGNNVYANFNLTLVDDCDIYVGDDVMFAPNVTLVTAGHPIEPNLRKDKAQFNVSVHIKNNVWLGAGVIVLPGVTIGENSVIGAGSVVTKDIPANSVAYGNPCRVVRSINDRDREYYYKSMKIDI